MKAAIKILCLLVIVETLATTAGSNASQREGKQKQISTPEVFASGIVCTGNEFTVTFMPDRKEAYFTRFNAKQRINHIYRTLLVNGEWQTPTLVEFSRDEFRDLDPSVSPDGKRMFFTSTRPKPNGDPSAPTRDMNIWVADRQGNGWGTPQWIENINSPTKEGSASVARDGTLYFFSDRGAAPNKNSIYSSKLVNGNYVAPERLSSEINSGPSDTSPFIAPNGKTLLFYSTRDGGLGKGDLYVSFKKQGGWSPAVNLGPVVNTPDGEYNPSVSRDGEYLYFGRNEYIYMISLKAVGLKSLQSSLFR